VGLTCNMANNIRGMQASVVSNYVDQSMKGGQLAIYNSAQTMSGIQVGLVNYAEELRGVQVGLINVDDDSPIPFLPFFQAGL